MRIEFLRDSAVATLATLQAGQPRNCGSIPWQTQRYFLFPKTPCLVFSGDLGLVPRGQNGRTCCWAFNSISSES